jgi:short-subunit dehydrogenase
VAGSIALDLKQQQQQQQDGQFYCLHLDHAAQDLHKAQERLARHILQVGPSSLVNNAGQSTVGCALSTVQSRIVQHSAVQYSTEVGWGDPA